MEMDPKTGLIHDKYVIKKIKPIPNPEELEGFVSASRVSHEVLRRTKKQNQYVRTPQLLVK